jgi:hypothetical protein
VTIGRAGKDGQDFGSLVSGQTGKITQFDQLYLQRIIGRQFLERYTLGPTRSAADTSHSAATGTTIEFCSSLLRRTRGTLESPTCKQ